MVSMSSIISEKFSLNCLKSFALLSDHKHFYLTSCIGIFHYFQLHLATCHYFEFSYLWGNLFFFFFQCCFFLWIVQKFLNNVLHFEVSKLLWGNFYCGKEGNFYHELTKGISYFFRFYQFRNSLFESFGISAVHGGQWNDLRSDWWRKGANQKRYVRFSILFFIESILHVSMSEMLGEKEYIAFQCYEWYWGTLTAHSATDSQYRFLCKHCWTSLTFEVKYQLYLYSVCNFYNSVRWCSFEVISDLIIPEQVQRSCLICHKG